MFQERWEEPQPTGADADTPAPQARRTPEVWARAERKQAGVAWFKANALEGDSPESRSLAEVVEYGAGDGRVSLRMSVEEDRCGRGLEIAVRSASRRLSWTVDRFDRPGGGMEAVGSMRGYLAVVPIAALATVQSVGRTFPAVDLLDAGAGSTVDALARKLEGAGFRVGHRGKAGQARSATEVYFAPGFEAEARELAKLAGAAEDAVKPLSWKSPYAVTVAAGGAGRSPRVPPNHSRHRAIPR